MTARRFFHGMTCYKPEKAYNGFTLFAPMVPKQSNVWLIDMQGRFVHRWQIPGWIRLHADLLPSGNILTGIADPEHPYHHFPYAGADLIEMDWDGNVVWRYHEILMDCHDRVRLKNGNTLIIRYTELPKELAAKVKGGMALAEGVVKTLTSYVMIEITPEGKVANEWNVYEKMDTEVDLIQPFSPRILWPGLNSLEELPNGDIMICSFNTFNIYIMERETGDVKWRWGHGFISMPHNPTMLDNGNILVLDNGRYPTSPPPDGSRVIEVNPKTNEIEWEYRSENPVDFHTTYIGGCERLPNGNTLICEGAMGRLFEVTPRGEMVWEYIVPFYAIGEEYPYGLSNCTFRCHRYSPDYPGLQGKVLRPGKLDIWNQLYGPEAFEAWGRSVGTGIGAR